MSENNTPNGYWKVLAPVATALAAAGILGGVAMYRSMVTREDLADAIRLQREELTTMNRAVMELQSEQVKRAPSYAAIPTIQANIDQLRSLVSSQAVAEAKVSRMQEDIGGMRQDLRELAKEIRGEVRNRKGSE